MKDGKNEQSGPPMVCGKTKFRTSLERFPANEAGRVPMVEVRLSKTRTAFGAGHCSIFEGETFVDAVAVLVRGETTYKTLLRQEEAADWLVRQGCPIDKAADLLEEALRRKTRGSTKEERRDAGSDIEP